MIIDARANIADDTRRAPAAIAIALLSALFFIQTHVLNRAIANAGGHGAWTASLRYLLTLPLLLPLVTRALCTDRGA